MKAADERFVRLEEWKRLQKDIPSCRACLETSSEATLPLKPGEIPDPPPRIVTLFVGVAPTAQYGPNHGKHFYSWTGDNLRRGLFRMLRDEFGHSLKGLGLEEGNRRFHELDFFFVHSVKVRPRKDNAPPESIMRRCAIEHLRVEIPLLNPRFVCFLGSMNAAPAAEAVFEQTIFDIPVNTRIQDWSGKVVVSPQPLYWSGPNRRAAARVVRRCGRSDGHIGSCQIL